MVLRHTALCILAALLCCMPVSAQRIAKYGADFLAGGVDARALAMGGANVAHTRNVNSVYWNPAGLAHAEYPEIAYMHAERFAGIVSFDFAAIAYPVTRNSTVGLSFFRSGVNDIKNTLNAWDAERNQPKANAQSYITSFSAADMAFLLSYARRINSAIQLWCLGEDHPAHHRRFCRRMGGIAWMRVPSGMGTGSWSGCKFRICPQCSRAGV